MNRFALLVLVLLVVNPCRGQEAKPLDVHRDIVYASPGNIAQTLDIYMPTGLVAPPPLVIYLHGGGYVSPASAPFFIGHGDADQVVPLQQSIELNDALQKAGVESMLAVVKGGGHEFNDPPTALAAVAFLKKHLGVQ